MTATPIPLINTAPRSVAPALPTQGCWPVDDMGFLAPTTWQARTLTEHDEHHLQLIPCRRLHNADALICEGKTPVVRAHLGLLYGARGLSQHAPQPLSGEALFALGFRTPAAIATDPSFELRSRLSASHLAAEPSRAP